MENPGAVAGGEAEGSKAAGFRFLIVLGISEKRALV
jgi:hypothetical protein